ncbi:transcriptional regulator family: C2H2 zinc finger [Purpureocillium lilacinum]|uniref:Transcriptional regulator family: C2H2 zinc finger n=1 Tax=Purpureocillium lilacinum TaxID=33203 RepID=A0ABR0BC28_PURLI|nr:transcriptional regulator family: C2H2 zinc finger [Purpureocillium lilacinum]
MSWPLFKPVVPITEYALHHDESILLPPHDTKTELPLSPFARVPNNRHDSDASSFTALDDIMKPPGPYPLYHGVSETGCDPYRPESNQPARLVGLEDGDGLPHSGPGQPTALSAVAISSKNDVAPAQQGYLPLRCSVCGKEFTRRRYVNRHFRIHTRRERDLYSCIWCDKKLTRNDTLIRHMKLFHGQNGSPTCSSRSSRSSTHDKENVVQGQFDRHSGLDAGDTGYGMLAAAPSFDEYDDHHGAGDDLYEKMLADALRLN